MHGEKQRNIWEMNRQPRQEAAATKWHARIGDETFQDKCCDSLLLMLTHFIGVFICIDINSENTPDTTICN